MNRFVVVRYGEIALKQGNRKLFEKVLVNNIKRQIGRSTVERIRGRIIVSVPSESLRPAKEIISRTFGIQNFSVGTWTSYDLEDIYLTSVDLAKDELKRGRKTFKVETRRLDKRFPLKSVELNPLVGERILEELPETNVNIHNPEFKIEIEIRDEGVLISSGKTPASGGLPVGVSGRALLLLSGGIDSPVAGWLAQKRGLDLDAIHFSSPPYTGERSFDKVLSLAKALSIFNGGREFRLYSMHFTDAQVAVHKHVEERYSLVCQRRLMMKIASKIAEAQRIIAIVTGENLGQVASQTLENMRIIEEQTELLVLRPLLTYDKIETVELAKRIGTFETSTLPYEDCCTVFVPSNPVTKARLFDINRVETGLDLESLAKDTISKSRMYKIKNGKVLEVKNIEISEEAS